jgi:hypothetical protein
LRGAEPQRVTGFARVELAQRRARGGGPDRTENVRRVPAFHVVHVGLASDELGPDFVARDVSVEHLRAGRSQLLADSQNSRHQRGTRMAAQRDVVVIERVRRDSHDERGFGRRSLPIAEPELHRAWR